MIDQKTTVDWLRFRTKTQPQNVLGALKPMFGDLGQWAHVKPLERGILGFQQGLEIKVADMIVGRMDFGGESQRGWVRVDLSAKGCEWITSWNELEHLEQLPCAEIRRLDLALTTWDGEMTHGQVVQAHAQGKFITRGRPPVLRQITSSDPLAGQTCYIGQREQSDKFMRCYEKGLELASKFSARGSRTLTHIDGKKVEDIYRCEVEFKASATSIPWEVIERRDQYFSGAYPFCGDLLPNVESDILMRRPQRGPQTDMAAALDNVRIQYGATLYTALRAYHGDITAVWDKVIGDHHSQALVESGVLLVEHS